MEFNYEFAGFVYIIYSLHSKHHWCCIQYFNIKKKDMHYNHSYVMEQFIIISAVTRQSFSKLLYIESPNHCRFKIVQTVFI